MVSFGGLTSRRIGRKPVIILSLVGLLLNACWDIIVMWFWKTIPLRAIWADVVFTFIGGGDSVTLMVFYVGIGKLTVSVPKVAAVTSDIGLPSLNIIFTKQC